MACVSSSKVSSWVVSFFTALTVSTGLSAMERPGAASDDGRPTASAASSASAAAADAPENPQLQGTPFEQFKRLPEELQERVVSFLGPFGTLKTLTVSKGWKAMASQSLEGFLESHFQREPDAYAAVLQAMGPMGPTDAESKQVFGKAFLRYLLKSTSPYFLKNVPQIFIELMCAWGSPQAFDLRIYGYSHGSYGYPQNFAKVVELNKALADQGNEKAIQRHIEGYAYGHYGYPQDSEKAREFNEALADQGNEDAVWLRIYGYANGYYGYLKNPAKARALNDTLADEGNEHAIERRIDGYARGKHGYPQESRSLSQKVIAQGNLIEIARKIDLLTNELFFFERFSSDFKQALESLMRTFVPKELEVSEEAPAAAAASAAGVDESEN